MGYWERKGDYVSYVLCYIKVASAYQDCFITGLKTVK